MTDGIHGEGRRRAGLDVLPRLFLCDDGTIDVDTVPPRPSAPTTRKRPGRIEADVEAGPTPALDNGPCVL